MKGEILAALYSFGCGKKKALLKVDPLLIQSARSGKVTKKLIQTLEKLEPYPFYRLIAKANHIVNPFHVDVVRAYWTGSELLDRVKPENVEELIKEGFPEIEDKAKLSKIVFLLFGIKESQGIPFHAWKVLYPFWNVIKKTFFKDQQDLDDCRISWGKIKERRGDKLIVETQPLKFERSVCLDDPINTEIEAGLVLNPKIRDQISIHLKHAREILNPEEIANLKKYTQRTLDVLNGLKRK